MASADAAWRAALRRISIADLAWGVDEDYGPTARAGIRTWLTGPGGDDGAPHDG